MKRLAAILLLITPVMAEDLDPAGDGWYPDGFFQHCATYPEECTLQGAVTTTNRLETINAINRKVNRSITYKAEEGDLFSLAPDQGDCEDYALTKRRLLSEAGIPRSAMRYAFGEVSNGELHVALVVSTDKGEFVLDNRWDDLKRLDDFDFRTLSLQDRVNPKTWWFIR